MAPKKNNRRHDAELPPPRRAEADAEALRFACGGECVCRLDDGKFCFVRGAIPGERLRVAVTSEKASFARGEVREVLSPAAGRREPECPRFAECPGCSYLHLDYGREVEAKAGVFADLLLRAKLAAPEALLPPFASPKRFGCRNKLTPVVAAAPGGTRFAAFRAADNTTPVPLPSAGCPLAEEGINNMLPVAVAAAAPGERLLLRSDGDGGVFAANLSGDGNGTLLEELGGLRFEVSLRGFFQTNRAVAGELMRRVADAVAGGRPAEVLELYCGVGVFSIAAALRLRECRFHGIEVAPEAIRGARRNAERHGVAARCRFSVGDAEKAEIPDSADVVIIDPPRRGLSPELCRKLIRCRARRIVCVSCAPDTLCRDLTRLAAGGWRVTSAGLLDMFPGTAHFESLTLLDRSRAGKEAPESPFPHT